MPQTSFVEKSACAILVAIMPKQSQNTAGSGLCNGTRSTVVAGFLGHRRTVLGFILGCVVASLFTSDTGLKVSFLTWEVAGTHDREAAGSAASKISGHNVSGKSDGEATSSSSSSMEELLTTCRAISEVEKAELAEEIADYEKSGTFRDKINEVQRKAAMAKQHKGIIAYLSEKVLKQGWSVLELGCAAGMMLQLVQQSYKKQQKSYGDLVGVELVTGWVKFAQSFHKEIQVFEGDITDYNLPSPYNKKTFDFVMLNDVAEYIQKDRYGCFFRKLQQVTHAGSLVYMHTPTPQAQLADDGQFYENVLPHHMVVMGMSLAGFELLSFEHDVETKCDGNLRRDGGRGVKDYNDLPKIVQHARCTQNGWVKYYHVLFRRINDDRILQLS